MNQVVKITLEDFQKAHDRRIVGPLEEMLENLLGHVKSKHGSPVIAKIDFPEDGGVEIRFGTHSRMAKILWAFAKPRLSIWE